MLNHIHVCMPKSNYQHKFSNLSSRKTDELLQKSFVSESFRDKTIPETVRYVFESMREIEPSYTRRTYVEAEKMQEHITNHLPGNVKVDFRYQGSVPLNTHIRLHSDLDLLVIYKGFIGRDSLAQVANPYPEERTVSDLRMLRKNIKDGLLITYPTALVSDNSAKAISIKRGSPIRKYDIIVCNWFEPAANYGYIDSTDSNRGVEIYDKKADQRLPPDFPFTHMLRVEEKSRRIIFENFKRTVRLLKNLKADANDHIDLSSFMITSVMYHLDDYKYKIETQNSTALLVNASEHLGRVIDDSAFRIRLKSPNEKEFLFAVKEAHKVAELKRLKRELDDTIEDLVDEIQPSYRRLIELSGSPYIGKLYEPLREARFNFK